MKNILILFGILIFSNCVGQSLTVNPNPFFQRTQVCYTLDVADTITIVIYDRWGQGILTLVSNSPTPAGVYCDSLILDSFEDNVYFLTLKNNQKNLTNIKIIKSASTSIQEKFTEMIFKVYPNPFQHFLRIEFGSETARARLSIIDVFGQSICYSSSVYDTQEIDFSFLSSGIYFLEFQTPIDQKVIKVIKE